MSEDDKTAEQSIEDSRYAINKDLEGDIRIIAERLISQNVKLWSRQWGTISICISFQLRSSHKIALFLWIMILWNMAC